MRVTLNGEPRDVPAALTVTGLLAWVGVKTDRVAVEVNAQVVTRAKHATTVLSAGDVVEVVTFVGGG